MSISIQPLPATNWKESSTPEEAERFERYAEVFGKIQRRWAEGGSPGRALHLKGSVGLEAEFTVLPDIPEYTRVGLFAAPATYRAYVRFSNGAAVRQADLRPDLRGLAIKVVGVAGRKLLPGKEGALTQDFTLARGSVLPFRNADEFSIFVGSFLTPASIVPRLFTNFGALGAPRFVRRILTLIRQPLQPLASTGYFSALPIRYGAFAARYAIVPHDPLTAAAPPDSPPDFLRDGLAQRLRQGPVRYDLRVQFFRDERRTPIEDASIDWSESHAPYLTVARLVIPRQDLDSARGQQVAEYVERLLFSPWHAQEEFRPLGSMMRARRYAYLRSAQGRGAAPEPDGTELPHLENNGEGRLTTG